jgi:hypothetical protein
VELSLACFPVLRGYWLVLWALHRRLWRVLQRVFESLRGLHEVRMQLRMHSGAHRASHTPHDDSPASRPCRRSPGAADVCPACILPPIHFKSSENRWATRLTLTVWQCCCSSNRPTPFYTTFAVVIGFIIMGYGASAAASAPSTCTEKLTLWCGIAMFLALIHILFALYYYFLFAKIAQDKGGLANVNMGDEATNIFCYDPWTALYIILYIFSFAWGIVGMNWASAEKGCTGDAIRDNTSQLGLLLVIFGVPCSLITKQPLESIHA